MPKFTELITPEHVTGTRNISLYITKAFEIRKKTLFRECMYLVCPSCFHVHSWCVELLLYLYI